MRHTLQVGRRVSVALVGLMVLLLIAMPAVALDGETFAITSVDVVNQTIVITNHGESDVDPNGLIVCNFPDYAPIAGAPTLAPGESVEIDIAAIGIPADGSAGEMGLYLTNDFTDPNALVSYVEWGSGGHTRSPVAIDAGVWEEGFVDNAGGPFSSAEAFPVTASDWTAEAGELPATGTSTTAMALAGATLLGLGWLMTRRSVSAA